MKYELLYYTVEDFNDGIEDAFAMSDEGGKLS